VLGEPAAEEYPAAVGQPTFVDAVSVEFAGIELELGRRYLLDRDVVRLLASDDA
jgi:hypothetical protein